MQILNIEYSSRIKSYIRTVNNHPMLTAKEEKKLAKKLYYKNDIKSAKILILSHLRFVIHITKNYSGYGLLQADLIQEGNIGLMKAVKRFNPNIGVRLVSFAVHWIKAEIHEYVLRNWRIVKVATTKAQRKLFFNLRKNKSRLGWFTQYELNIVAKELGVKIKDVIEMESRMSAQDTTFDPIPDNEKYEGQFNVYNSLHLEDKFSDFADNIEEKNWENYAINKLNNVLNKLDKRSKEIINSRWLNNNNKITLKALANKFGISAERIRQLEKNAMKKIRSKIES